MAETEAHGWKARLSIPVNYNSDSEDDFDEGAVVTRAAQRRRDAAAGSAWLLADGGDGAPADLLGTTPPRARIRSKEKRRNNMDTDMTLNRLLRANRRNTVDAATHEFAAPAQPDSPERLKKRNTLKTLRGRERDFKLDVGQAREHRSDSLPSPSFQEPVIPNIVESCSRFMSLTSRLKCSPESVECRRGAREEPREEQEAPRSRIDFHNTFSMLIRMGNVDKNCRRAISVEEQVWQNERKDLIWLELRARLAGRTLQQQDEYLCAQRQVIPSIVQNINNYRFVNTTPCTYRSSRLSTTPASEGYHSSDETPPLQRNGADPLDTITENLCRDVYNGDDERYQIFGCLGFECDACSSAVGKALKEVGTLLDSFYNAETLYPSSKAMAMKHPLIATQLFNNRLKAMCLWYNIAHILRLKVLGIRKLIKLLQWKAYNRQRSQQRPRPANPERGSETESRPTPVVKFSDARSGSGSNDSSNSASSGGLAVPVVTLTLDEDAHTDSDGESKRARRRESGTVDTTASNESGYTSEPECTSYLKVLASCDEAYNVIEVGPLSDITKLRLLGNCEVSPYRHYISDILKTQGLRKALMFIDKMRQNILKRAYMTFEKYNSSQQSQYPECEQAQIFDDTKDPKDDEDKSDRCRYENAKNAFELRRYGCWSEETLQMRLPSYRSTFLLLSTVCMEVVHDYLSMRLETQPAKPSCLTVKQLMHELKEGLDIATEQRSAFVRNIDTALGGYDTSGETKETFVRVVQVFDSTIERVLTQYLSYLTTMSEVEHMPRSMLEAEWGFAARLARRTRCAAMLAPHIFANIMSNQIEGVTVRFRDKFRQLQRHEGLLADGSDEDESTKRHWVYAICRQAQGIYVSERELTIQTAQFSRLLATRLKKNACMQTAREKIFNSLMNARNCIVEYINLTTKKTDASSWDEDMGLSDFQGIAVRVREVLLQGYKLGFEFHKELHSFCHPRKPTHAPEPTTPARRRPASLQPLTETYLRPKMGSVMVNESYNLALNNLFHKEMHRFVNDMASERVKPAPFNNRRPSSINVPAARVRPRLARSDSVGGEAYNAAVFQDCLQTTTSIEYGVPEMLFDGEEAFGRDSIARAADWASEPRAHGDGARDQAGGARDQADGARDQTGGARDLEAAWAEAAARAVIEFAKNWMRFVTERCDRGRGLRPRWASQGLEFLMLACDPCNTKHLTEAEFEELKSCMDGCISHVVGSRSPGVVPPAQVATPPPQRGRHAPRSYSPHPLIQMQSKQKEVPTPPTPPTEPDPVVVFNMEEESLHSRRAARAAREIDASRDEQLAERRVVGRVVETAGVASQEPKLRQVTFRWQRGLKIGAGNFGKVYTVVNTESGQLLAMKEISIGLGDRRALQRAANELKVLEGILHPHLVRYYGCEVHREEMLIFMELCVEGSLEALLAESGALPEPAIRRYTKQLVSAVLELHNRQIAHRDIKTGNIFLTNERHCLKLGDFGCAVKIRANTTAAGELQGYVGTQAYMAPEVFMKSSGHGRAADIWSLGCVVTEMASGKRPFSEYDSNYQIMFVVGMGGRPEVAASLSGEGREFCLACLEHDPELRPSAADVIDHHFLKLKADEDQCDCKPGYLISK